MRDDRPFVLRGAMIYGLGDTDTPEAADVVVRDGRIQSVGDAVPISLDMGSIDLRGRLLVPGFVNAHFHSHDVLAKGTFESISLEQWGLIAGHIGAGRSVEEVRLRTLLGARECLRNGITTIQDFAVIAPLRPEYLDAIIDAYATAGVRVALSVSMRDLTALDTLPYGDELIDAEARSLFGTAPSADEQLSFVERELGRFGTSRLLSWGVSPSAPTRCTLPFLRKIGEFARANQLPVFTHVYESRLQRLFAKTKLREFGGSEIEFLDLAGLLGPQTTIAHGVWIDDDEIRKVAASGTAVVLNVLSNLKLRNGVPPLAEYRRLGVPLCLGCDNCSCSDVQSMVQVMRLYCLLCGITEIDVDRPVASEAIELATVGGARSLGLRDRVGKIAVGMEADLIAIDLKDPSWQPFNSAARQLVFSETGRGISDVWVAGQRVIQNRQCMTIKDESIRAELERLMPAVQSEIKSQSFKADALSGAFKIIQRRARETDLGITRYLASRD